MLKLVGISFGLPLLVLGLGGMIFAAHGLIDPAAAQLSDDASPFAASQSLLHSLLVFAMYLGISAAGALILWSCFRKRRVSA